MHLSHWLDEALDNEIALGNARDTPRLTGNLSTDVCIVGGGFTGLWTSIHLKMLMPTVNIALIEKGICGQGASGRNVGFVMSWMSKAETVTQLMGPEEARHWLNVSEQAISDIEDFCKLHNIECHFRRKGWAWVASNDAQAGAWESTLQVLDTLNFNAFDQPSREKLQEMTGSTLFVDGVIERNVASVQPALLARGLRRVAIDLGVKIFEQTPMVGYTASATPKIMTRSGEISARSVVLCLDSWAHELPEFRTKIIPVAYDVVVTEPAPELVKKLNLDTGIAVSDSRILVECYRSTADGRLVFGKVGNHFARFGRVGSCFDGPASTSTETIRRMHATLPSLADVAIAKTWRGPTSRSSTGLPVFGRIAKSRVFFGHGYTGNGVGPSYTGGRVLASLALDLEDRWARFPLANSNAGRRLPWEPVRSIGGCLAYRATRRVDRAGDEGTIPTALDRWLVSFVPKGLTPSKKK